MINESQLNLARPHRDGGIMVVEDHSLTNELLVELLLEALPGIGVRAARSAEEALEQCAVRLPRLIVMDIGLPGASGIDATRRIKALSPSVFVVIHSGSDHAIYRELCAAAGVDAFISKLCSHAQLVPAIAQLLAFPLAAPVTHSVDP